LSGENWCNSDFSSSKCEGKRNLNYPEQIETNPAVVLPITFLRHATAIDRHADSDCLLQQHLEKWLSLTSM
jgi:hypothetical protein